MTVDRPLPGQEFFRGQPITLQSVFEREQAAAHGGDHLGLAADHPPAGIRRRQIPQRQRRARGADHVGFPAAVRARLLLQHHGFYAFPTITVEREYRPRPLTTAEALW